MKNTGGLIRNLVVVAATVLTVGSLAHAEKMNAEIHSVVIEKLELALSNAREDETVSLKPVRARLSDLYAERARLRAMDEAEKNCQDCKGALNDRVRALSLYKQVLVDASKSERGPLLLQMAQMHELNLEPKKSEAIYEQIVAEGRSKHSKDVLAEGYIGRAETRFSNGKVELAKADFTTAYGMVETTRKGPILHRIAWCELNEGKQAQATNSLIRILETPALLTREASNGETFDAAFQEDVARDLATFLARGKVSNREIALLESHAPERAKKDIMKHFAGECDRLGQKQASIEAWAAVAKYETNTTDRIETMVHVAQLRFEIGQKKDSLRDMKSTVAYWSKNGCEDAEQCDVFKGQLRKLVIDWNRAEKKNPTGLLVDAYLAYLAGFPDDMEMNQWAAEAARTAKRYADAASLYHKAATLAAVPASSPAKVKDSKLILEASTVGEVEMAELSKDNRTRELSYDSYLKLNPSGAIAGKVRYQRAHVAYERGEVREASARFYAFAMQSPECRSNASKENAKLCVQAADLDLDSLVGLKEDAVVQARAAEYAKAYPSRSGEYMKMSRTAVLKQAEKQEPTVALAKLNEADLSGASVEERVRILKTRLALAERSKNIEEVRRSAEVLLRTKGLTADDKEFAMGKLAWGAEMSMDFSEAYAMTSHMKLASMKADERAMKLALLAELSGHDPRRHEEDFLRTSRDRFQQAFIRAKLVRTSKNPARELAKHESYIKPFPQIYAAVALEIFAATGNRSFAEKALKVRGVAQQPAGRLMGREMFLRELGSMSRALANHKIRSSSESLMQRSLQERLKLLASAERFGNQAIASKDWTVQLMALSTLSRENKRVYADIVSLPIPRALKGKARQNYVRTVEASAHSYITKSDQIDKKLTLLWGDNESQDALASDYRTARPQVRGLLAGEIRTLSSIAPSGIRGELDGTLRSGADVASEQAIASARREAREKPFSAPTIAKLRDLETVRGRETMVAYLDARLLKLKTQEQR